MNTILTKALNTPAPKFTLYDYMRGDNELLTAGALLYLVIYDYEHPDAENLTEIRTAIIDKLKPILYEGNEPTFDCGHCWGYMPLCAAITMIKNKADLWNLFDEESQTRLTQCMRMFLFMWNWGCNKYNNYRTGPGMRGNFTKVNSVNYQLSNNVLMAFIRHFFEVPGKGTFTNCNQILNTADYDAEMTVLKNFGWTHAYDTWTTPEAKINEEVTTPSAKEVFKNGGKVFIPKRQFDEINPFFAGYGKGVKINVSYPIDDFRQLIPEILSFCYSGTCVSRVTIEDYNTTVGLPQHLTSPYEGQLGMMEEFNHTFDGVSRRSSMFHCDIDFCLSVMVMAVAKHLGIFDITTSSIKDRIKTGISDYLYKKSTNCYSSFSLGNSEPNLTLIDTKFWNDYWHTTLEDLLNA